MVWTRVPAEPCDALPALYCLGDAAHCGELVSFEPASLGSGEVEVSITGSVGGFFFQDCATIRITGRTPPGQLRVKRRHATPIIPFARPGGRHIWHQ